MKDLGEVDVFLAIKITRSEKGIFLGSFSLYSQGNIIILTENLHAHLMMCKALQEL